MLPALVAVFLFAGVCAQQQLPQPLGRKYWERVGKEELMKSLQVKLNRNVAKNIIIFVGDGMGATTATAARIYRAGENSLLSWEEFPHVGAIKTYTEDKTVTDSAAAATSLFTGVKTNRGVLGLSGDVKRNDCKSAQREEVQLTHITTLAQQAGKATGFVTTSVVTDATPAGTFARSANRNWECYTPSDASDCKDVGRQLIEDIPGRDINVILGGGSKILRHNITDDDPNPIEEVCTRADGRNLIDEWAKDKKMRQKRYAVVNNTRSLLAADLSNTDYLLGVFAKGFLPYHHERITTIDGTPSLQDMTTAAIKVLKNNKNGFFLMVENEHIDAAHHKAHARKAISETVVLHDTVKATLKLLEECGILDETLVLVTSDHSHTLTISGYPTRGNSILGIADKDRYGKPYTTLSYANGVKEGFHYKVEGGEVTREDPSLVDTTAWDYHQTVSVVKDENSHGGHDVLIYAMGPYAHLFHHMHEQTYINYVMKYAARLGEYSNMIPEASELTSSSTRILASSSLPLLIIICLHKLFTAS